MLWQRMVFRTLVDLPLERGCKWAFTIKVNHNGSLARLVTKGYSPTYRVDYLDTFSPVAKMTFVRLFLSLVDHN